jgi:serine palmitoyltransferase
MGTTLKARLGRLLGAKSRFRKSSTLATVPEAETLSTSSAASDKSDDDSVLFYYPSGSDPFADVRERMEELAIRDRQRFVGATTTTTNCEENESAAKSVHVDEGIPPVVAYFVYLSYAVLIFMGHLRDFLALLLRRGRYLRRQTGYPSDDLQFYAPLLKSWENFFTRRLYSRIQDVFNRPIASNPGAIISVMERVSDNGQKSMKVLGSLKNLDTDRQRQEYIYGKYYATTHDGKVARNCLNLGSYNYLGFADDWATTCASDVKGSLGELPVSVSSARNEYGSTVLHRELERTVAAFLGKEDALVLNMGFNTNATTIPALVGPGDLLLSDELNHTSIVNGARASGAAIRIFRHNDMDHLDSVLREAVVMGRPRTRRPWNKILVIVEGIYSMEGEYCDLRNIVRVCKKYGAYVYLDEAHSIGAMGATGRGVAEYTGTDTADIDIMMGTFTKSFGGMGGYIAASKETIAFLRLRCSGSAYHNALSPVVCQQVLTSFKVSHTCAMDCMQLY